MKQNTIFSFLMALGFAALVSCNNSSNTTANNKDSLGTTVTDNTSTSTGDYSAYADEIEKNSATGVYVNPKTGKAYGRLHVNRTTGEVTDENNEPVWRYVDTRNWWVYGVDDDWNWRKLNEAKMGNSNQLLYLDDNGNWVTYDAYWKPRDENLDKTWKSKSGDMKIKFGKDGDVKMKDESGKTKYDADDNKVKTDSLR